jgi:nucleoside-diphosphate-sugar epimerase
MNEQRLVVVAGGAGYIGSVLCPHLLDAGYRVRVIDRCFFGAGTLDACRKHGARFELLRIDSRTVSPEHFHGAELAVDLSGLSNDPACDIDPEVTRSINVEAGTILVRAAKAAHVRRYIYQSSCSVYGTGKDTFLDEEAPLAPVSAYGRSKAATERIVLGEASPTFEVVVPRMGTVYGLSPRMRFDLVINLMTLRAERERRIFVLGGGSQWRPLIHVRDAARALRLLLEAEAGKVGGRVFNVGSTAQNFRVVRLARLVAEAVDGTQLISVPEDPDPRSYRVDFDRFEDGLGFVPERTPKDGVTEILSGLREETIDTDIRTRTVEYYRYLLDAKRVLDEVLLDGKLL